METNVIPYTLEGEILRRKLRRDYSSFVEYANPGFYMTTFHRYLCKEIQEFLDTPSHNAIDILLLSVPPRHGKSYTVTETLPAWFLGRDPTANVIIASYETTFAEAFGRRNRDKFVRYCGDIFGSQPNKNVQGVGLWETEEGGRCRSAGLKAGITGHGAELFIIDDPIKSKEQADSDVVVAKIHDEMGPSVQSRIHPGGKLIVIQTRWIENDVVGWIETNWGEYIYKTINLPCECVDPESDPLGRSLGDSLMGPHLGDDDLPQRIKNDNEWLKSKKRLVIRSDGDRTWNALYQGMPAAQAGNLYKRESWQKYRRTDDLRAELEYLQLSIDASFKSTETSDFVAMELWGLKGRNTYLWKLVNKRMGFVQTVEYIRKIFAEFSDIDECVIEEKANGSAIIDVLNQYDDVPPIVAIDPRGGKLARGQATSPFIAGKNVYLPEDFTDAEEGDVEWDGKENLPAINKFIEQHAMFPFAKRDDMVDAQTQGINRIMKLIIGEIPMPPKRNLKYRKWYPDMWEDYNSLDDVGKDKFVHIYGAPLEWQDIA